MTDEHSPAESRRPAVAAALTVRVRPSWHWAGRVVSSLIICLAAGAFVVGGARGDGLVDYVFLAVGVLGAVFFGAGALLSAGRLLSRRPVLELDADGVRRPAAWPRPRSRDRVLPWSQIAAVCLVSRGVAARSGQARDHLLFLTDPQDAEHARTADKPQLVAFTLTDLPAGERHAPWLLVCDPDWDVPLKRIVAKARAHGVPVIDRRRK